jgi:acyl-CoA dehydrogenase
MGRKAVDSNELFFEDFEIPMADRIGAEDRRFEYILEGMNPERILIAAEAVGLGKLALSRATEYAKTRVVFNRPIGKNQAIQHPLAVNWVELEAVSATRKNSMPSATCLRSSSHASRRSAHSWH